MARRRAGSWNSIDLENNDASSKAFISQSTRNGRSSGVSTPSSLTPNVCKAIATCCRKKKVCSKHCILGALGVFVFYLVLVGSWNLFHTTEPCQVARDAAANLKRSAKRFEQAASAEKEERHDTFPSERKPPELPKIIHHQWKDENIPEKYDAWHQRWLDLYPAPDYTHMLWTDESARQLIQEHYPWFLPTYDDYNMPMKRADAARYFYLFHYGGLHTDLDYEPLSNDIFTHLPTDRVALVESPYKFSEHVQNSLMSSPKGDQFWSLVFTLLIQNSERPLLSATGPKLLDKALAKSSSSSSSSSSLLRPVHVLPCENFHRIPLGERKISPTVTNLAREVLARIYPMKQCGSYHRNDDCHFAKHHNTAIYVAESSWWDLLWNM